MLEKSVRLLRRGLFAAVTLNLVAACSTAQPATSPTTIVRPPGQQFIELANSGEISAHAWRVEIVRQGSKVCLQGVIDAGIMSTTCDFQTDDRKLPVNFDLVGNDKIMFVTGSVADRIAALQIIADPAESSTAVQIVQRKDGPERLFGFAARPGSVIDFVGLDKDGKQIYSGGTKIRTAPDGDSPSAH